MGRGSERSRAYRRGKESGSVELQVRARVGSKVFVGRAAQNERRRRRRLLLNRRERWLSSATRRGACLLAQQHSPGLLMIIEPEISRCGRDAGGMDLRGAVFSSANTDSGCAHKRHCESNRDCNQMLDGHEFISLHCDTLRERGDFGATLSALTVNPLTVSAEIRHFVMAITAAGRRQTGVATLGLVSRSYARAAPCPARPVARENRSRGRRPWQRADAECSSGDAARDAA